MLSVCLGQKGKLGGRGEKYLVAFINKLMGPRNQFKPIHMIELRRDLIPKQPSSPPWTHRPRPHILRVTPDQVAKRALMRDLLRARNHADLIEGADFGGKAAVDAEDLAVDYGAQNEEVEDLAACFPDAGVAVFLLAFFVEAVNLGYLPRFVVAADEGHAVGVSGEMRLVGFEGEGD